MGLVGVLEGFLGGARVVWLVFTRGRAWYRGGVRGWAGASGRLDVAARVYIAACGGLGDCVLVVEMLGPGILLLRGGGLGDERSIGSWMLRCLAGRGEDCVFIPGVDAREVLGVALGLGFRPLLLSEECSVSWRVSLGGRVVLLGGSVDPPGWVRRVSGECVSVGPGSYLASSVAAFLRVLEGLDP